MSLSVCYLSALVRPTTRLTNLYGFLEFDHSAPDYSVGSGVGLVVLDDCNFHESVRLDDFETERALTLVSPFLALCT